MTSTIRILDNITINQIAAGEVIENPPSVIKELVENALDAGATSIRIEIEGGGRHRIQVSDNGKGMIREDALLCFERHATSKVYKIEDLDTLASMGFRGEALPSIASIAKVRLKTRPRTLPQGTLVEIQGNKVSTCADIPCDVGTSIEVEDLFYNVPARRKFLKSPKADFMEIQKLLHEIAFGNLGVHFVFIADGKKEMDLTSASTHLERAKQLLNEGVLENMFPFAYAEGEMKMEGLLGNPSLHRPNRTGQSLFLNQRPVNSWEVAQAVLEGYLTSLPERRYPLFYLHLTLPPHEFDINVHPQKKEVRFAHLSQIKESVTRGISGALSKLSKPNFFKSYPIPVATVLPQVKEPLPRVSYFTKEPTFVPMPLPLSIPLPKILAVLPLYIILEGEEGIQLVDIQRARKRIIYEKMVENLHQKKGEKQQLLVPLTFIFSDEETHVLKEHLSALHEVGFSFSCKELLAIDAIPSFIKESEVETTLQGLAQAFIQNQKIDLSSAVAEAACRHIEKEKRILSEMEAQLLIKSLYSCQQPHFTSTGQVIVAKIKWEDLRGYFT